MMLYAGVAGTGYGIYIAVDQALNVDVLPSQEEAGKDLGILNLANTVGQVLAPVIVGGVVAPAAMRPSSRSPSSACLWVQWLSC